MFDSYIPILEKETHNLVVLRVTHDMHTVIMCMNNEILAT